MAGFGSTSAFPYRGPQRLVGVISAGAPTQGWPGRGGSMGDPIPTSHNNLGQLAGQTSKGDREGEPRGEKEHGL